MANKRDSDNVLELSTTVSFRAEDVARSAGYDQAMAFVEDLDLAYGDWTFSLKLIEYALKIRGEYLKECADDGTEPDPCVTVRQ